MERYTILITIFKELRKQDLITEKELEAINEQLKEKYKPIIDLTL